MIRQGDQARVRDKMQQHLMVGLFKWAHGQQENFTTDAFAHLVQALTARRPVVARELIIWLAELPEGVLKSPSGQDTWKLSTQEIVDAHGIPDFRLRAHDVDLIIEVKLDGSASHKQLSDYGAALEKAGAAHQALVSLTGRRAKETLPAPTVVRLWHEVGSWLLDHVGEDQDGDPVCSYLAKEFVALLRHQGLAAFRVRSLLSRGALEHRDAQDLAEQKSPLYDRRTRSLDRLTPHSALHPLRDLLTLVSQALRQMAHSDSVTVDSAVGEWIGLNLNGLEFLCVVELSDPDVLVLERWGSGIERDSWDGSVGEVYESAGACRWRVCLDLVSSGFFTGDHKKQRKIVDEFLRDGLAYGRFLTGA